MASTRIFLDLRGKAKDGKGSLVIRLINSYTSTTIPTGIRIYPYEWDGSKVIINANSQAMNTALAKQKSEIDKKILVLSMNYDISSLSAAEIKERITDKATRQHSNRHLVSEVFREYMATTMQDGTRKIYECALKKITDFAGDKIYIDEINHKWLKQFESFLARTQGVNGRAMYLRDLRTICNYARHSEYIIKDPFITFTIATEQTRKRNITIDKLVELYKYPVSPQDQVYKDYFFLMFFLIGINASDLFLAKPEDVINGRLEYFREKTHKKYSIKLEPEALELLDRYKGENWLVEVGDHVKSYQNYLHMMNNHLKAIGKVTWEMIPNNNPYNPPKFQKRIEPIIEGLTSYYARHTWATLAYDIGIPTDVISQALGHSSGNRTTLIYIKFDQDKVDAANRTVIDYFMKALE